MPGIRVFLPIVLGLAANVTLAQDDPFKSQVRPTDPLSPADQQKTFTVPDGFKIELFAAEPEILKPMNLAFDVRGRLWASMSQEYPYAAPDDRLARDCIKILEDTTGDGHADKITTFADNLNIPIGLYPYKNGVIAWSIPFIWYLEDTDGDDVADKRTKLYGPMGFERDTHGMNNAFTRHFDGWLHACHGFNNQTMVAGADGHTIEMHSGNTYRMRLHGERIEHYTWGQVNPFGMTIDQWGNLFSADCHSKPIYQLLQYAYYPSFGKPHDGLGYLPPMMDHLHGSTAIAGVVTLDDERFHEHLRGDMLCGNVMTSRVNRNRIERNGATCKAVEKPDFLICEDPWFRPVDLQLGPDGAIYVADFYNRIIGHYEVPLDHEGRDRTSGRIWKISPINAEEEQESHDLTRMELEDLVEQLASSNLTQRNLATDYLSDTIGPPAVSLLNKTVTTSESPEQIVHALWVLFRLEALNETNWESLLNHDSDLVKAHAVQILGRLPEWSGKQRALVLSQLSSKEGFVKLAVVEAIENHGIDPIFATTLLIHHWDESEKTDPVLAQAIKIALRNLSRDKTFFEELHSGVNDPHTLDRIAEFSLGLNTEYVGRFLLSYIRKDTNRAVQSPQYVEHAIKNLSEEQIVETIALIRTQFEDRVDLQMRLFTTVESGLKLDQARKTPEMRDWATSLVKLLDKMVRRIKFAWTIEPHPTVPSGRSPWGLQERTCTDAEKIAVISSIVNGENLTGVFRSKPFAPPEKLSFYLCGHRGFPKNAAHEHNLVRLLDAATGEVLASVFPPRNDVAHKIEWELTEHQGKKVVLEIIDGDTNRAFAWLAVGRFEPNVISIPTHSPAQYDRSLEWLAELIGSYRLSEYADRLPQYIEEVAIDDVSRQRFASALLSFSPDPLLNAMVETLDDPDVPTDLKQTLLNLLTGKVSIDREILLLQFVGSVPQARQLEIAQKLASSREGGEVLINLAEQGKISARLLQSQNVFQRLEASKIENLKQRVEAVTRNLPSLKTELIKLIEQRKTSYRGKNASPERGKILFEKHCQNCHQIAGNGAIVGPQLDGIGNRGLSRLLEDTLDPNQNVDVAFHTTTVVLDDGKVLTGLVKKKETDTWTLADNKGKEFTIAVSSIDEAVQSPLSLMPENIARELTEAEFFDLMSFLLDQTAKPAPSEN